MWRALVLLLAFLLAGCTGAPPPTPEDPPGPPEALPFQTAGRLWLPEQSSADPATTAVEFEVNASGFDVVANIRIAASLGAADAPATVSTVTMILLDPDGAELARASHTPGPPSSHELRAVAPLAGIYQLVLGSERTGGGAGTGDYAEFNITAAPPPA